MQHLILTISAPDQPGLVERLARRVGDHQGNWLESRMARMAGQFAGILRVAVPEDHREALIAALQALDAEGMHILVAESGIEANQQWYYLTLDLVSNDRPDIVRTITAALREQGVNVERLNTEVGPAPMSAELLFKASALLAVPHVLAEADLRAALERLSDEFMVDLQPYRERD